MSLLASEAKIARRLLAIAGTHPTLIHASVPSLLPNPPLPPPISRLNGIVSDDFVTLGGGLIHGVVWDLLVNMTKRSHKEEWILLALYRILGSSTYTRGWWTAQNAADIITTEYELSGAAVVSATAVRNAVKKIRPMEGDDFTLPWREGCPNPHQSKRQESKIVSIRGSTKKPKSGARAVMVLGWSETGTGEWQFPDPKTIRKRLKITDAEKKRVATGLTGGCSINDQGKEADGRKRQATTGTNEGQAEEEGSPAGRKKQRVEVPSITCTIDGVGTYIIDVESVPADIIAFITAKGRLVESDPSSPPCPNTTTAITPTSTAAAAAGAAAAAAATEMEGGTEEGTLTLAKRKFTRGVKMQPYGDKGMEWPMPSGWTMHYDAVHNPMIEELKAYRKFTKNTFCMQQCNISKTANWYSLTQELKKHELGRLVKEEKVGSAAVWKDIKSFEPLADEMMALLGIG